MPSLFFLDLEDLTQKRFPFPRCHEPQRLFKVILYGQLCGTLIPIFGNTA